MPVCVMSDHVVDGSTRPATDYWTLRPEPTITDLSTCAYVLQTSSEYSLGLGALASMSIEEATVISTAVGLLWAVAWGIRVVARAVGSGDSGSSD